ncbi:MULTISPECIES: hypothetical protein [unclassified Rhizobium]|uniref:hypothetical protein n=1 Tax=unclassified Rhizobium TaxID=2613769 RepID=UPI0007F06A63|nr:MULTISPECIES: hypothetical protein [unclassified Rhizobium]ANK91522.1 hypothetical protein AMK01_CH02063 [Rhizobium sp. N6212]ANK97555.1 hypothetical protein AMK00_CH02065 [Rhizobium sp. N621]
MQGYIDLAYVGTITVTMNDCGEPPPQQPFAHRGSILSNYEQVLFDRIAALEYEQEMLSSLPTINNQRPAQMEQLLSVLE